MEQKSKINKVTVSCKHQNVMLSTSGGFSPTTLVSALSNALSDFDPKHHVGALPCRSYQPIESRIMILEDG
jgi:hypothetical protein